MVWIEVSLVTCSLLTRLYPRDMAIHRQLVKQTTVKPVFYDHPLVPIIMVVNDRCL